MIKTLFNDVEYLLALVLAALLVILLLPVAAAAAVTAIPMFIVLVCFAFLLDFIHL